MWSTLHGFFFTLRWAHNDATREPTRPPIDQFPFAWHPCNPIQLVREEVAPMVESKTRESSRRRHREHHKRRSSRSRSRSRSTGKTSSHSRRSRSRSRSTQRDVPRKLSNGSTYSSTSSHRSRSRSLSRNRRDRSSGRSRRRDDDSSRSRRRRGSLTSGSSSASSHRRHHRDHDRERRHRSGASSSLSSRSRRHRHRSRRHASRSRSASRSRPHERRDSDPQETTSARRKRDRSASVSASKSPERKKISTDTTDDAKKNSKQAQSKQETNATTEAQKDSTGEKQPQSTEKTENAVKMQPNGGHEAQKPKLINGLMTLHAASRSSSSSEVKPPVTVSKQDKVEPKATENGTDSASQNMKSPGKPQNKSSAFSSSCSTPNSTTKSKAGGNSSYVSAIKMDILKALAEARSTIAEIKGVTGTSPQKATESANGDQNGTQEETSASDNKQATSPAEQPSGTEPNTQEESHEQVDHFDMFAIEEPEAIKDIGASKPSNVVPIVPITAPQSNCDDADGYYKTAVGEILNDKYRVLGVVGKGVFSTVLRCQQLDRSSASIVAVKLIRNNDTMRDAAQTEIRILRELADKDPRDKKHVIRLLDVFDHCSHVALVFEPMQMNLREAMKKFGGKGGISIQAVRVFCKHLLVALNHLDACGIVHADIKPDNILLDDKQSMVKVCDFGSAFKLEGGQHDPTPYLVSRFYRAPEIVLGLAYDKAVDMWSVGCCLYEMFTGKVLFPGGTNNEMLKCFMQLKGKIPNKIIKKHRTAYLEQLEKEPHFTEDLKFCSRECDRVTGKPVLRLMDVVKDKMDLGSSLLSAKSSTDDRKQVLELRNLLERMFMIDPSKRISVKEALAHPFVKSS